MDGTDRHIIHRLEEDARTTWESLAKDLGMSGVAVKKRVAKLVDGDDIRTGAKVNVEGRGYYLNLILLEVDNESNLSSIIRDFSACPRVVSMFTALGGYNLVSLVIAEDRGTLESEIMGNCSLRTKEGIRRSEVIPLERKVHDPFLEIRSRLATRDREKTPCGLDCGVCRRYLDEDCLGCPATRYYRGDL